MRFNIASLMIQNLLRIMIHNLVWKIKAKAQGTLSNKANKDRHSKVEIKIIKMGFSNIDWVEIKYKANMS